jgi:hypothetical protein
LLSDALLDSLLKIAVKYKDRVDESLIMPRVNWRQTHNDHRHTPQNGNGNGDKPRAAQPAVAGSQRRTR